MPAPKLNLPNVKKMFVPAPDYCFVEGDLSGADAQVTAHECGGAFAHDFFSGVKIHQETMRYIYPEYFAIDPKHEPYYTRCKNKLYGTIYGGKPPTIAEESGSELWRVRKFQPWILGKYPEIRTWQDAIHTELSKHGTVTNAFGFRIVFFQRIEEVFTEALAWRASSTVSEVCFRGALQVMEHEIPNLHFRPIVHDSVLFMFPIRDWPKTLYLIEDLLPNPVTYPDGQLLIPWTVKASTISWGDCQEFKHTDTGIPYLPTWKIEDRKKFVDKNGDLR